MRRGGVEANRLVHNDHGRARVRVQRRSRLPRGCIRDCVRIRGWARLPEYSYRFNSARLSFLRKPRALRGNS